MEKTKDTQTEGQDNSNVLPPYTLRCKGGDPKAEDPQKRPTDPVKLSRSILHVLRQNPEGWANIQCVGPHALYNACRAYHHVKSEVEKHSGAIKLVQDQWPYVAEIGGKPAHGICVHIFPIPVVHAR